MSMNLKQTLQAVYTPVVKVAITAVFLLLVLSSSGFRGGATSQGQDGPTSVTHGNVFKSGELKIESYDLSTMPPLPAGYQALNNKAYLITTSGSVSGPHIMHFSAASISDEETFRRIRIFHAEPDTFDPESPVWVDLTLLDKGDGSYNFASKIIRASSYTLGVFVIGKQVHDVPVISGTADLIVTCESALDRVQAPNSIGYTVKVVNKGPDIASNVGLIDSLTGPVSFQSWEPSQGKCKKGIGSIYCKLGSLKPGEAATIKIKLEPEEGFGSFSPDGHTVSNNAYAAAQQKDPDPENNRSFAITRVLPDSNLPPTVTLISPKEGQLYTGPADIILEAVAKDDRTIEKVEFFDNGTPIGAGTSIGGETYRLVMRSVSFGKHRIWAVATDNGGRKAGSDTALVVVNGLANINFVSPREGSLFAPESNAMLTARVVHPSGLITKVEVFANDEKLGEAIPEEKDTYHFTWKLVLRSAYSLVLVATDGSGITTTSTPIRIIVDKPPTVSIVEPVSGTSYSAPVNLSISITATQLEGQIKKIDLYANDRLLGSASDVSNDNFKFTWRSVEKGEYRLKAIAQNDLGVTNTSEEVRISVTPRNKE